MFNFQFWVRLKIDSWYYLTWCTSILFFTFFNLLLNKSNCFRTVELHAIQLIIILFHLTDLTDLTLYYFNLLYYWWHGVKVGPGPWDPGPRDSRPGTPLKFKSGTPRTPSKFKSGTSGPPTKFKSGTPSPFFNEFIFKKIFFRFFDLFIFVCFF